MPDLNIAYGDIGSFNLPSERQGGSTKWMSAQITKMFITGIYGNCMANIGENILKKA
jgi:hypothetical protein